MKRRILFVDDEPLVLQTLKIVLTHTPEEWDMEFMDSAEDALRRLAEQSFEVVVSDMQMPEMNGVEFLSQVEAKAPDSIRIMFTGDADQSTARDAVNRGHVFRFLNKTSSAEELSRTLQAALREHRLVTAERELLERTLNGGVKILTDILAMLDPVSFNTGQRLREYLGQCLSALNLPHTWDLDLAAMLLQIGRVMIPGSLLERAASGGNLTEPEMAMLDRVPQIGFELLSNIPRLEPVAEVIRYQNKNFDGTGFPADAVSGDKIPPGSRILRVLNDLATYEMRKVSRFDAFNQMKQAQGRYDPQMLATIYKSLGLYHRPETLAKSEVFQVTFDKLRVGCILKSDLVTKDGMLVAVAETEISEMLLKKLHNFAQLSGIKEPICIVKN